MVLRALVEFGVLAVVQVGIKDRLLCQEQPEEPVHTLDREGQRATSDTGVEVTLTDEVALENLVLPLANRSVAPRFSVALLIEREAIGDGVLHLSCLRWTALDVL